MLPSSVFFDQSFEHQQVSEGPNTNEDIARSTTFITTSRDLGTASVSSEMASASSPQESDESAECDDDGGGASSN